MQTFNSNWIRKEAPHILHKLPGSIVRAMQAALRAVDRDVEQHGAVTYETVEQVRRVRALSRTF